MRKKSHISLAKYLLNSQGMEKLQSHKKAFYFGSILPDCVPTFLTRRHTIEDTFDILEKEIRKLTENYDMERGIGSYYCRHMGVITHYVADYFTAPHNEHGEFGLRDHCAFEKQQLYRLRSQLRGQWNTPKQYQMQGDVMEYIKTIHDEYLEQMPQVETDCSYIVNVTEQIAYQMFSLFNERQAHTAHARFFRHHAAM